MLLRDAEDDGPQFLFFRRIGFKRRKEGLRPGFGAVPLGIAVFQSLNIKVPASPRDVREAHGIREHKVVKGYEEILFNGFRKPDFCRNTAVKVAENAASVGALGRGGKAQKNFGRKVLEHRVVRVCSRMVRFVRHNHVKVVPGKPREIHRIFECLHRGKDRAVVRGLCVSRHQ